MSASKQEKKARRMSVAGGLIFTGFLYWIRLGLVTNLPDDPDRARYLLFVGDISSWPSHARSWLPLDTTECFLGFVLSMYLIMKAARSSYEHKSEVKNTALWIVALSTTVAAFISMVQGWLFGIQAFVLGMFFFLGVLAVAGIVGGTAAGIVWCAKKSGLFIRTTPIGRVLVRFGRYMNASDASDDSHVGV